MDDNLNQRLQEMTEGERSEWLNQIDSDYSRQRIDYNQWSNMTRVFTQLTGEERPIPSITYGKLRT